MYCNLYRTTFQNKLSIIIIIFSFIYFIYIYIYINCICFLLHLFSFINDVVLKRVGWLVVCFGVNDPFKKYFNLYRAVSQRDGKTGGKG